MQLINAARLGRPLTAFVGTMTVVCINLHAVEVNSNNYRLTFREHVFLPRDAMHSAVFVIVNLSVCLSVILVDCVHMDRPTIVISSPHGTP